jgi:hypothetical protein
MTLLRWVTVSRSIILLFGEEPLQFLGREGLGPGDDCVDGCRIETSTQDAVKLDRIPDLNPIRVCLCDDVVIPSGFVDAPVFSEILVSGSR